MPILSVWELFDGWEGKRVCSKVPSKLSILWRKKFLRYVRVYHGSPFIGVKNIVKWNTFVSLSLSLWKRFSIQELLYDHLIDSTIGSTENDYIYPGIKNFYINLSLRINKDVSHQSKGRGLMCWRIYTISR